MSLLVPARRPGRELLDDPSLPADEMRRSLEDIALVHKSWRGWRALATHLARRIRLLRLPAASILDLGGGTGEVARRLASRLDETGAQVRVTVLDLQWRHLALGRSQHPDGPPAVCADAFRLPFPDGSFDFAVSTLFFHHFSPEENRSLITAMVRVARHGFAVLDLRRHILPALFVGLVGRLLFRTRVSVHDGVASVRQAYTPEEALDVARDIGRAERVFPFALLITGGR